ncbi:MAG: cytochrome oxidase maturation protein, cbb3-type [Bacteroidetes bacterium 4484_249]|nr:MAG: cytochrome oxidase maturation protein, cbb3-type [Bacteroidetes bacterium 4484_249]
MSIVFILIIIGVVVAGGFLAAFIWAVKSGQYEDNYSPPVRVLFDDYVVAEKTTDNNTNNKNNKKKSSKSNKPV